MKRIFALALCGVLLLSGCGGTGQPQVSGAPAGGSSPAALKELDVVLDWYPNAVHAFLYEAQEKGYFAEEGLNVEFYYAAAADIVKNVAAGNVEFGFPNADAVVAAKAQGIPVKVVHTTYQEGLGAIIFGSDSGISTPASG